MNLDGFDRLSAKSRTAGCCCCTFTLILIILLALSFSTVGFDEYAFVKSRISGSVDSSTVYSSGYYALGPDKYFVKYPAKAQTETFKGLNSWSKKSDVDAGTQLTLDISIQYRIIRDQLPELYKKVALQYDKFIGNIAINSFKNSAPLFSADDFLEKRREVEDTFKDAAAEQLRSEANCEILAVQLRRVQFPEKFYSRKLAAGIQIQRNEEERYKANARKVRGETEELVKYVANDATQIVGEAKAEAYSIDLKTKNERAMIEASSRIEGLKSLKEALDITDEKKVVTLDYVLNLRRSNPKLMVNFGDVPEAKSLIP